MRLGLGLGLGRNRTQGGGFDPETLAWEGYWRTNYPGSPWLGTASAGGSGARNLTTLDAEPTAGPAQNGRVPAEFVAASSHSLGGAAVSSLVSNGALFWFALVRFPSATAGASPGALPAVWADSAGNMFVSYGTIAGVHTLTFMKHDGTAQRIAQLTGDLTGAYHLLHGRVYDPGGGRVISVGVDGVWSDGDAIAAAGSLAGTLVVGKQPGVDFMNLRLAELALAPTDHSASLASIQSYVDLLYAL